ncbi:MAG: SLBB domain-containing protein [Rubrivivax sp.]
MDRLPYADDIAPRRVVGEFELYVRRLANLPELKRFGVDLVSPMFDGTESPDAPDYSPLVPPDYLLQVGDEVVVALWGSVVADLRATIDRSGRISLPRIGSVMLAGVRYGDLPDVISRRVAAVYKNFQLSVTLGQLRGLRVYVTGFVQKPGAVTVNALSTVTAAVLAAEGPSNAGSLRNIELRRRGSLVSRLDLYDLLLRGNREADMLLQPGDVVHVGPVGSLVAIIGSVNQPAIYELKPKETLADALQMAGGFAAVADTSRITLERLDQRAGSRIAELALPQDGPQPLRNADVLRVFSAVSAQMPVARQNKRVRVDGEVKQPGDFVLPPASTLIDALLAAGGLTDEAYLYGSQFNRESVREQQQQNYERALRDLETDFTRSNSTQRIASAEDSVTASERNAAAARLIARLRLVKPTGRVVLQLKPSGGTLPALVLEDGDTLYVPPRPVTVGVFGSVFNPGSYLYDSPRTVDDYLRLAGGPTRGADKGSAFMVRADGTVVSGLQSSAWFGIGDSFYKQQVQPGDTIFSPEEINKTTLTQGFKDWTQILYQFGLGVAGLRVIGF